MTLQLLTDRPPFFNVENPMTVVYRVCEGQTPPRPTWDDCRGLSLTDGLWRLMENCWSTVRECRPVIQDLIEAAEHGWPVPAEDIQILDPFPETEISDDLILPDTNVLPPPSRIPTGVIAFRCHHETAYVGVTTDYEVRSLFTYSWLPYQRVNILSFSPIGRVGRCDGYFPAAFKGRSTESHSIYKHPPYWRKAGDCLYHSNRLVFCDFTAVKVRYY
jgi:hypothetical protein